MSDTTEGQKRGVLVAISAGAVVIVAVIAVLIGMSSGSDDTTATTGTPASNGDGGESADAGDTTEDGTSSEGAGEPDQPMSQGGSFVPEAVGGQQAIDALGENIEAVAQKNDMSVEELKDLLLRDTTAKVSPGGFILYVDPAPEG